MSRLVLFFGLLGLYILVVLSLSTDPRVRETQRKNSEFDISQSKITVAGVVICETDRLRRNSFKNEFTLINPDPKTVILKLKDVSCGCGSVWIDDLKLAEGAHFELPARQQASLAIEHSVPMYESAHELGVLLGTESRLINVNSQVRVLEQLVAAPRNLPLVFTGEDRIARCSDAVITYRSYKPLDVNLKVNSASSMLRTLKVRQILKIPSPEFSGVFINRWRLGFEIEDVSRPGTLTAAVINERNQAEICRIDIPFFIQ